MLNKAFNHGTPEKQDEQDRALSRRPKFVARPVAQKAKASMVAEKMLKDHPELMAELAK
jgi:hypothetical protein